MNVVLKSSEGFPVLSVSGRIDTLSSGEFKDQLMALIDRGDNRFILDISDVDYVSSAGLRVFIMVQKRLSSSNGMMPIVGLQALVKNIFDISGLTSFFSFEASLSAAVSKLM